MVKEKGLVHLLRACGEKKSRVPDEDVNSRSSDYRSDILLKRWIVYIQALARALV